MTITLSSTSLTATVANPTHFLLHDLDLANLSHRLRRTYPTLDIDFLISEYRRFLVIKFTSRDEHANLLSPSPMIDQVWHEHILDTKSYIGMCLAIGLWIHHDPDGADDKDTVDRERRRSNTISMYTARFGHMDRRVWDMEGFDRPYLPGMDPFAMSGESDLVGAADDNGPAEQVVSAEQVAGEEDEDESNYLDIRVRGLDGVITPMEATYDMRFRDIAQVYINACGLQGKQVRFFQAGWGIDAGCGFTVNELGIRDGDLVTIAEECDID